MSLTRWTSAVAALVVSAAACSSPSEPIISATVTVDPTVVASRTTTATGAIISFTVPVTVINTGRGAISPDFCANSVDFLRGGSWSETWRPTCVLSGPDVVPAGGSGSYSLTVSAGLGGSFFPQWLAPEGVPLRVSVALVSDAVATNTTRIASNNFALTIAP
jgi:hypothetical protein